MLSPHTAKLLFISLHMTEDKKLKKVIAWPRINSLLYKLKANTTIKTKHKKYKIPVQRKYFLLYKMLL